MIETPEQPEQERLPFILLQWDAEKQDVHWQIDFEKLKTWELILVILEIAKIKAEVRLRLGMAERAAIQRQQEAQELAVRQQLLNPGLTQRK